MSLALNPEQGVLYEKIVSQKFSKILVLGSGGVGKTFCLCAAVSELARRGTNNMVLCAPTHLARLNIHAKLDKDIRHLVETTTVASLLLKFGIQKDDGTLQFTAGKLDKINKYSVIILDECSMISEQDYMMFMQSKAKVVFLGDHKQLPPVMAKSCESKMNTHSGTGNLEVFKLTQQMRQKGGGIIHEAAEKNRLTAWFPEDSVEGKDGESITVHGNEDNMVKCMINNILSDSRGYDSIHHHRYIAYKNTQIRSVGKEVRDQVLGSYFGFDTNSLPFICNEIVMIRENKKSIGYNGELVKIVNVKRDTGKYSNYPWDTYHLTLQGTLGTSTIRTLPPCQYPQFESYINRLQSELRRFQIAGQGISAKNMLSEIKRIRSQWTVIQYPWAVTTHKSQGSTIENVYLNTFSFAQAPNRRALLYVGISRASRSLHTVRVPASKQLQRGQVNSEYRAARSAYEDISGESYKSVLRYLNLSTRTLTGKQIATEYLWARVADIKQELN